MFNLKDFVYFSLKGKCKRGIILEKITKETLTKTERDYRIEFKKHHSVWLDEEYVFKTKQQCRNAIKMEKTLALCKAIEICLNRIKEGIATTEELVPLLEQLYKGF